MNLPSGISWRDVRTVTNGGKERILWNLVDPWIRQAVLPGDLAALASYLRISMKTMAQRRSHLGMPATRPGRPRNPVPTTHQMEAVIAMSKTGSPTKAAKLLGTSPASVSAAVARAKTKTITELMASQCPACRGTGVVPCSSCHTARNAERHGHVCDRCLGAGHV